MKHILYVLFLSCFVSGAFADGTDTNAKCRGFSFDYKSGQVGSVACDGMVGIDATNTASCSCTCNSGNWEKCTVSSCKPGYNFNANYTGCVPSYSGAVVDKSGTPLAFVTILSSQDRTNSSYFYETDVNGKFTIPTDQFPDDGMALFSIVGCKDKTLKLTSGMRVVLDCSNELDGATLVECGADTLKKLKASAAKFNPETDKCEATTCIAGAYFVYSKDNAFMGYCEDNSYCGAGKKLVTDGYKTSLECVPDVKLPVLDEDIEIIDEEVEIDDDLFRDLKEDDFVVNKLPLIPVLDDDIEIIDEEVEIDDDLFKNLEDSKLDIKIMNPDQPKIDACNKKYGARWNSVTRTCECIDRQNTDWNSDKTACVETQDAKIRRRESAITGAVSTLDVALSDLAVSKWKTADGKFNTARLASDTIAGVVLGTAGGLITSHVVKKHQVEEGFEDIKCVIGGQSVAGWGDEFNVGVH
ncbi:MAG: carboxypeptidase regulatory-like domain-containing protein [Alphaproteobacteria bacterium]|nr:carboxypeptidase regulatory-like domain-containing protein [Alphaproteobacteria bacterium]